MERGEFSSGSDLGLGYTAQCARQHNNPVRGRAPAQQQLEFSPHRWAARGNVELCGAGSISRYQIGGVLRPLEARQGRKDVFLDVRAEFTIVA